MRKYRFMSALAFMIACAPLAHAQSKTATVDCYCTDKNGARVELGTVNCMQVDGRVFMARCEMALNNPFWREVEGNCFNS